MKSKLILLIVLMVSVCQLQAQDLSGVKIYINPGHGGYNSGNDRNVVVYPFKAGDTNGFWESKSNLEKGLFLYTLLKNSKATVYISRIQNRDEDDRPLSEIAQEANTYGVDFMLAIHSNAHNGITNYPLMLFNGYDDKPRPEKPDTVIWQESKDIATVIWNNLHKNKITCWTYNRLNVRGDLSFRPDLGTGFGVLAPLMVPGIISEGSFHDYIPETYRLLNSNYKKLEAYGLLNAFIEYFTPNGSSYPYGVLAGTVKSCNEIITFPTNYKYIQNSTDQYLPIHNAKVTLLDEAGEEEIKTVITDTLYNGIFFIDSVLPAKYKLKYEAAKYGTVIRDIEIAAGQITFADTLLENEHLSIQTRINYKDNNCVIYPNPAREYVKLLLSTESYPIEVSIINIVGKQMLKQHLKSAQEKLYIGNFPKGIYVLLAKTKQTSYQRKLVVR